MPTLTINLTDEEIADILTTACEGGSNYWARSDKHLSKALTQTVKVWDCEDGRYLGELTADKCRAAATKMAAIVKNRSILADLLQDPGAMDAGGADLFLQIALLGEVVYG